MNRYEQKDVQSDRKKWLIDAKNDFIWHYFFYLYTLFFTIWDLGHLNKLTKNWYEQKDVQADQKKWLIHTKNDFMWHETGLHRQVWKMLKIPSILCSTLSWPVFLYNYNWRKSIIENIPFFILFHNTCALILVIPSGLQFNNNCKILQLSSRYD